jgi:hypothetical protein
MSNITQTCIQSNFECLCYENNTLVHSTSYCFFQLHASCTDIRIDEPWSDNPADVSGELLMAWQGWCS